MLTFDPHTIDANMARAMTYSGGAGTHHHHLPMMQMDISETDKEYRFQVDLPGCKKENIDVTIDDDVLTIQAERVTEAEEDNMNWVCVCVCVNVCVCVSIYPRICFIQLLFLLPWGHITTIFTTHTHISTHTYM